MNLRRFAIAILALTLALLASSALAQPTYETPSPALTAIVDAPTTPEASLSPKGDWLLLLDVPVLPGIAELAEPELRLAGLRVRARTFAPSRAFTFTGLRLVRVADASEHAVGGLPPSNKESPLRIASPRWSPDGKHVAFTLELADRVEPWVLDVSTADARRLAGVRLNLAAFNAPSWLPDSSGLLAALVPADLGEAPEPTLVPAGPVIEETTGRTAPGRTWQDLLASPHDEAMFEHVFTAALAAIHLDGRVEELAASSLLWSFSASPDGRYMLVERLHRPFSYRVPAFRFPRTIDVLALTERTGKSVRRIADLPLQEEVPITFGSVPTGPRDVDWRSDAPSTVAWVEALDGGDAKAKATERDRLFALAAPFSGDPKAIATLDLRVDGVSWGRDDLALVTTSWWQTRREKVLRIAPGSATSPSAAGAASIVFDRQYEDRYADPGNPLLRWNETGHAVLQTADGGRALVLAGAGASPEGDRPFLDVYDLASGRSERLFRSTAPVYEQPLRLVDGAAVGASARPGDEPRWLLVRRESVTEPPNYFLRNLDSGELRQLTRFGHPTPQLAGFGKELIRYPRADGVELTGTLYTPPGWKPADGPLPVLLWAYPNEFKSADAASQVRDSPYRFDRVDHWSSLIWLALGYAVLDDPAMPIVGEGEVEPNDSYVTQLVQSAQAAVDELVRRGVADPKRVAVGGHSYGAFMTANLLAHSDIFAAGIARSGAYNRTLTPFGFQAEERTFWEAPEVYFAMSPFQNADHIDEPILLIHGQADNNSGTFPLQSERMYAALKGLGGTARLVLLPHESHGYRARESVLHMLWEQERWLERWVRKPTNEEAVPSSGSSPD